MGGHKKFESLPGWAKFLILRCLLPLLFVAAALVPELFIVKRFFPYPFLFLFFGAVLASAWFGGMFAGLCAVIFSILAVDRNTSASMSKLKLASRTAKAPAKLN